MTRISRRRFLHLSACSLAAALVPPHLWAQTPELFKGQWQGTALGADASLTLYGPDEKKTHQIITACLDEITRLEKIFSLFRRDSELVTLNKSGRLDSPSAELVDLLSLAKQMTQKTGGLFDVSVQPLWQLFTRHAAQNTVPKAKDIQQALSRVGADHIHVSSKRIVLEKENMALTLNGIAQGYITDRISELLQENRYHNILVNMGEWRAAGKHPQNRNWHIALPSQEVIALDNQAIATSSGQGMVLFQGSGINHLFNPLSGKSAQPKRNVSVVAPNATWADALSTALALCDVSQGQMILEKFPGTQAYYS